MQSTGFGLERAAGFLGGFPSPSATPAFCAPAYLAVFEAGLHPLLDISPRYFAR